MNIVSFIISSVIIIVIPGTGVIYTISTGLTKGKKASLYAAFGCTLGIVPHLVISLVLSALILNLGSTVFNIVKIAGALYLLYLGVGLIISKTKLDIKGSETDLKPFAIARQAVLINLLNPKLTLFFFSFLPQYLTVGNKNYVLEYILLGLAFMLLTLVVFIGYGILSGSAKRFIEKSPKAMGILQKCFGLIFIGFAVQLGLSSLSV